MDNLNMTTIIGALVTLVLTPLILDWVKRDWDYRTSQHKAKFEALTELSDILWAYHTQCANLYTLTYPLLIKNRPLEDIRKDLEREKPEFWRASTALYTGLYCYRSKIQQYYDNWVYINHFVDELIQWVFQDDENAMDDHFIILSQEEDFQNPVFRAQLDQDFVKFQEGASRILDLLARELRESRYFWYPILIGLKVKRLNKSLISASA